MSVEVREIKRRIGGIRQIQKATSAMEMIAAARMQKDRVAVTNSRRYTDRLVQLLSDLHAAAPETGHRLMTASGGRSVCLVLFGSDRGLCGGFNTVLMEELNAFHDRIGDRDMRLIVMGRVAHRRAQRGYKVDHFFHQPPHTTAGSGSQARGIMPADIARIAETVTASFLDGTFEEVHVLYSRFVSPMRQEPVVEKLLPADFSTARVHDSGGDLRGRDLTPAIFEPAPSEIFERLLPECVRRMIYNAYLNSVASETGARQTAMRRATENAEEMLDDLTLTYSRLRQESITTEMLELVGGSTS